MRVLASLTARLVLTAVALVAIVSLLVAGVTTLALRSQLIDQLDAKVLDAAHRVDAITRLPGGGLGSRPPLDPDGDGDYGNQTPGTLVVTFGTKTVGQIVGDRSGQDQDLTTDELEALARVPVDRSVHQVKISHLGVYRVTAFATPDGIRLTGLPTSDVDDTLDSLMWTEALLLALAVVAAAGIGTVVVRRQLRPLREVAATAHAVSELPLATGAITLEERVPEHLTDPRTEVGQVGAAINTMLEHVESSLTARHRSEQQVRQFVADASHELRTPLTTIAGYTELARRRPDDKAATDTALAKVEEESTRMTALVEDLLLLARLDAGRPLVRDEVDLSRLLIEAVSDARVLSPDHRWRMELPEDSVEVTGDEQRLHQVVTNLLTNARKYTPPGTTVTVRAHPGGFEVHDDGPGFPPDLVATAFERFARGDVARVRNVSTWANGASGEAAAYAEGGSGLGLSLVRAITTAHGGRVHLESTPGDTTVSVELPA
jgi:two-component system, OmpR family, sensor kinase